MQTMDRFKAKVAAAHVRAWAIDATRIERMAAAQDALAAAVLAAGAAEMSRNPADWRQAHRIATLATDAMLAACSVKVEA